MKIKEISILGLGHIGLPLACILADYGFQVYGVDNDESVIRRVQSGHIELPECNLRNLLKKVITNGSLTVAAKVSTADVHLIAVPTPIDADRQPDLSFVKSAIESIKPRLRGQDLVIIASTCPIGTTDQIASDLRQIFPDISVAYCPERVLPGNILHEFIHNDRVVGGIDELATKRAVSFYQTFAEGAIQTTNAKTAEAVKLAENAYRDVNIAFANELSMLADQLELNVHELIHIANRHPRVNILEPGPGVGGHCIAIDPWFLAAAAPDAAQLISRAREVNLRKTDWVVEKIRGAIRKHHPRAIACLGLTYKPDVSDLRESPALSIVKSLEPEITVYSVDPYVPNTVSLAHAIEAADIIVGLVKHREFRNLLPERLRGKIILDFAGVFG